MLIRQSFFNKKAIKKTYFHKTIIDHFNEKKLEFYRQLQEFFNQAIFFVHFFVDRVLFIDIDVSKRRDFDAVVYHLKSKVDVNKSKRIDIEFFFLIKCLTKQKKIINLRN